MAASLKVALTRPVAPPPESRIDWAAVGIYLACISISIGTYWGIWELVAFLRGVIAHTLHVS